MSNYISFTDKKSPGKGAKPKVWAGLLSRSSDVALFFSPVEDHQHTGHFKKYMQLVNEKKKGQFGK